MCDRLTERRVSLANEGGARKEEATKKNKTQKTAGCLGWESLSAWDEVMLHKTNCADGMPRRSIATVKLKLLCVLFVYLWSVWVKEYSLEKYTHARRVDLCA